MKVKRSQDINIKRQLVQKLYQDFYGIEPEKKVTPNKFNKKVYSQFQQFQNKKGQKIQQIKKQIQMKEIIDNYPVNYRVCYEKDMQYKKNDPFLERVLKDQEHRKKQFQNLQTIKQQFENDMAKKILTFSPQINKKNKQSRSVNDLLKWHDNIQNKLDKIRKDRYLQSDNKPKIKAKQVHYNNRYFKQKKEKILPVKEKNISERLYMYKRYYDQNKKSKIKQQTKGLFHPDLSKSRSQKKNKKVKSQSNKNKAKLLRQMTPKTQKFTRSIQQEFLSKNQQQKKSFENQDLQKTSNLFDQQNQDIKDSIKQNSNQTISQQQDSLQEIFENLNQQDNNRVNDIQEEKQQLNKEEQQINNDDINQINSQVEKVNQKIEESSNSIQQNEDIIQQDDKQQSNSIKNDNEKQQTIELENNSNKEQINNQKQNSNKQNVIYKHPIIQQKQNQLRQTLYSQHDKISETNRNYSLNTQFFNNLKISDISSIQIARENRISVKTENNIDTMKFKKNNTNTQLQQNQLFSEDEMISYDNDEVNNKSSQNNFNSNKNEKQIFEQDRKQSQSSQQIMNSNFNINEPNQHISFKKQTSISNSSNKIQSQEDKKNLNETQEYCELKQEQLFSEESQNNSIQESSQQDSHKQYKSFEEELNKKTQPQQIRNQSDTDKDIMNEIYNYVEKEQYRESLLFENNFDSIREQNKQNKNLFKKISKQIINQI